VAVKFDLYNDAGERTVSTGVYTEGAAPTMSATDLSSTRIVLKSGDLMQGHLVYSGITLTMTLTATVSGASVTEPYSVNIPAMVVSTTAYVGFTGSSSTGMATQQITSRTYPTP
jgi:hypothetical protein